MASALAVIALGGCGPHNAYQPPPPPDVTVQTPLRRDVVDHFEQTGQLAAVKSITVVARVEGFLDAIGYTDGAAVKQGTTLFTIEQAPYRAGLDQARANLEAAKAKAVFAQQQFDRYSALAKNDYASQMQAQQYTADRDSSQASVAQMQAELEKAQITYSYTTVTAPFAGKVTNHLQDVGALVGTSQTAQLATLVQTDPIWVNFNLSEADALKARARMAERGRTETDLRDVPVEIALQDESGYPHRGHMDYLSPMIDAGTGTLAARAVFDNADNALVPGAFVRVRIPTAKIAGALLVPEAALGNVQGDPILLVVNDRSVVEQRAVALGPRQDDLRVIARGLNADDRVIVDGLARVSVGETVAPKQAPQDGAAPSAAAPAPPRGATP